MKPTYFPQLIGAGLIPDQLLMLYRRTRNPLRTSYNALVWQTRRSISLPSR